MVERFKKIHIPCPCGKSSDAYALREDGSGFCFSCHKPKWPKEMKIEDDSRARMSDAKEELPSVKVEKVYQAWRGVSTRTMKFYGCQTKLVNGTPKQVYFPFGEDAAKLRRLDKPKNDAFECKGSFKDAPLFGLDLFDPGSRESITIFEGEPDALSGYDLIGHRSACVSLKTGAGSAFRDLQTNYEKINSFPKIYICFDADKPGQDAVQAIAGLFDFRKTYVVKLGRHKDCNEYHQAGEGDDFVRTWESAKRYAPDNIISSFGDISKALDVSEEDQLATYPFGDLNTRLYGIHAGEIIVIKAFEGVGKTEFFRAIEHHVLSTTDHPIGVIHLEEDNATTIKAIAGYEIERPAVLPDCGLSKQDILDGYRRAVRDDEGRVHIHSSFSVDDEESFLGNIRFLVSALGCRIIFLDHISWLATGSDDEDERRKLDRISQKLKLLAKELRCAILEISHVNDDGKTRGSRNISKVANTVIMLDRDILEGSNQTRFVVEKARLGGRTGPAGSGWFNEQKGKMEASPSGFLPEEV